ncbi:amidohydrolase family protein, partial [Ideonella azotifigens]
AVTALRPLWHELLTLFGPERLMWGSDWPVLTLAGSHAEWVAVSEALIGELSPEAQADVWTRNAQRFYGL